MMIHQLDYSQFPDKFSLPPALIDEDDETKKQGCGEVIDPESPTGNALVSFKGFDQDSQNKGE